MTTTPKQKATVPPRPLIRTFWVVHKTIVRLSGRSSRALATAGRQTVRSAEPREALSARQMDLRIRVGVHTGEVEFVGSDARGFAVHAAARVMALGGPDEVLVSSTTFDLLGGSGLKLEEAGTHEMKGLPCARKVFRLVLAAT